MGLFILVLVNVIYAGTPTFLKIAAAETSGTTIVWLRHALALTLLLPFAATTRRWKTMPLLDWARIALAALLSFTLASLLEITALRHTSASTGALMIALEPISMILLAMLCLRERLHRRQLLALGLAFFGLCLLSVANRNVSSHANLLFFLAIFCEAAFPILLRPLLARYTPLQIAVSTLSCATLYLLPFQWNHWEELTVIATRQWMPLLYLSVGCSAVASYLWLSSLQRFSVSASAITWFLQPVCGAGFAVLVLNESMTVPTLTGAGLILIAVGLLPHHAIAEPVVQPTLAAHIPRALPTPAPWRVRSLVATPRTFAPARLPLRAERRTVHQMPWQW